MNPAGGRGQTPVTYVKLRQDDYFAPFWSREEGLSEDFEDWEPYGMTRSTFDACIKWNETRGATPDTKHGEEKQRLLSLLRRELNGIEVEAD